MTLENILNSKEYNIYDLISSKYVEFYAHLLYKIKSPQQPCKYMSVGYSRIEHKKILNHVFYRFRLSVITILTGCD